MFEELTARDGHTFQCWMKPAVGTRRGGLVILQEIFGVTDQLKRLGDRYAALGYDIAIPALFDRIGRGIVVPFDEITRARDLMMSCDADATMTDIAAAVDALAARGNGKVAVMGFCWGGGLALRAAQALPVAGAVSFYGTRLTQYVNKPLRAAFLAHFGREDSHSPPEVIAELEEAFPDMEGHVYEAGHGFANEQRPSGYAPEATALAHERTEAFLEKVCA